MSAMSVGHRAIHYNALSVEIVSSAADGKLTTESSQFSVIIFIYCCELFPFSK